MDQVDLIAFFVVVELVLFGAHLFSGILARPSRRLIRAQLQKGL